MLGEQLEQEIDRWERRARGYSVYDYYVELEPAYSPLLAEFRANASPVIDDGVRPSLFRALFGSEAAKRSPPSRQIAEPQAPRFRATEELYELQIVLPQGFSARAAFAEEFLGCLHNLSHPVAFELLGLHQGVVLQLACVQADRPAVRDLLEAYFPEAKVREHQRFLSAEWNAFSRYATLIDFGLSEYFFRSLRTGPSLDADPLIGIVGALNDLSPGELGLVQVLFQPAWRPWAEDLHGLVHGVDGLAAIQPLIRQKFSTPLLACLTRIAALSHSPDASFDRARRLGNAVIAATRSEMNMLIPLDNEGYPDELHASDILRRETHRSGMLLNLSEVLSLVHLPSASVRSDRLVRQSGTTKRVPDIAIGNAAVLGTNEHDGEQTTVSLSTEQRLRHTYVIGASGTGKSTLLLSMIAQDLERGDGLAVLDPHGDLLDDVLARIPESRLDDVVLFDPSDEEYPIGFNILSAHSELERILLSSDLVGVFRRLSTSWGDQMNSVLSNAVLAFLESTEGGTLLDLRRFLVDPGFRKRHLETVTDPECVYFWEREFTLLRGLPQAPLLTRLDSFLRPKLIRYMVAQKDSKLDLRRLMDGKKILLAKLSQGAIGEENSYLLGSLLVAKINQAAMSRQETERGQRAPFFVYIDEFHNFITPSIASILSGARKYGIGLTLAHQEMRQLKSRSEEVQSAVLSNAYTRICFRVGDSDAKSLADGFGTFEAKDLQNLGIGEAIARVERSDFDFNLSTVPLPPVAPEEGSAKSAAARAGSRSRYTRAQGVIEAEIATNYVAADSQTLKPEARKRSVSDARAGTASERQSPAKQAPSEVERPAAKPLLHEPGRGGQQHKYLQALLKRTAEDRGFRATLEKTVLGGHGHIDVALERDSLSVACEISVTTSMEHELDNLSKCLASGFDRAVLVSSDKKLLHAAEGAFSPQLSVEAKSRVRYLTPEAFIGFLDQLVAESMATTKTVRGYKVNVQYRAVSEDERRRKEQILADVISDSLTKQKKAGRTK